MADGTPIGARVKDRFENRLHKAVCAGTMTLAEARREIGISWVHYWLGIPVAAGPSPAASSTPTPTPTPGSSARPSGAVMVTMTALTTPIAPGSNATATVKTTPGATCSIVVRYKSGPSKAAGLAPQTAAGAGIVSWTWKVGASTTPGSWPVTLTCTQGGVFGLGQSEPRSDLNRDQVCAV